MSLSVTGALSSRPKWVSASVFFAVWTLIGLTFAALSYGSGIGDSRYPGWRYALLLNLLRFYLWAALSPLIFRFTRRFPVELRPLRLRNLLLHIPAVFVFAAIHTVIHLALSWQLEPSFRQIFPSIRVFYLSGFFFLLSSNVLIASILFIAAHAFHYYEDYKAGEVKRSALEAQLAQAQLQTLKMQLHPHFLFNTLHSISSLVLEDPPRANGMIARLGDFLRLTLEHSDDQTVPLQQEIDFVRSYLEIEQARFEDRLSVDFKIEPAMLSVEVPHLILQPIVENAIRHAVAPRTAPGLIKIHATQFDGMVRLEVIDNGPGIKRNSDSIAKGVGLNNVRARLSQLYGTGYSFEITNNPEGGLSVVLILPIHSLLSEDAIAKSRLYQNRER